MIRTSIVLVCLVHTIAGGTSRGFGKADFGARGQNSFGSSDFGGNKIGGTSTLRKRGVIADPLSNTGFGKGDLVGGKGGSFDTNIGGSLLANDDLFRSPQGIDGSFGVSSKGIGGSFGSAKGIGGKSFGPSQINSGGSFGSAKGIGSSFGSSKGSASSFGSSKGIAGSFGSAKGLDSSFGSPKGIGVGSFGSSKSIPGPFGTSKGLGGSFGSKGGVGSFGSAKGVDNSFGKGNAFSSGGNSLKGGQAFSGKSVGGGFGGGDVFSKGFVGGDLYSQRQVPVRSFPKGNSFAGDYVNSFNDGYGIKGDGNIFGDDSSLLSGGKQLARGRSFDQSDIYGGDGIGKSGFVSKGSAGGFKSGGSGFSQSSSVSSNGGDFRGSGFSKNNIGQGFANFNENKGFGDVRRDYGIGDRNIIGNSDSFSGGSILPSKSSGIFNQGGFNDKSIQIGRGGFVKDDGLGNFKGLSGSNKGLSLASPGIAATDKGFDQNLYSTDDGRGGSVAGRDVYGGNAFSGKAGVRGSEIPFW